METPALAIQKGWHKVNRFGMAKDLTDMVDACPTAEWSTIEVGKTYLVKSGPYRQGVFTLQSVTPARKQITIKRWGEAQSTKQNASSFRDAVFVELDKDLISLLGVDHRIVVTSAISQGLTDEIPGPVRCGYPELFIDIPEQFGIRHETAAERVRRLVGRTGNWGTSVMNAARVELMIESAHEMLSTYYAYRIEAETRNPGIVPDMDRSIQEQEKSVAFFRWLIPHVSPGGALYIDGSELDIPEPRRQSTMRAEIVPPFMLEVVK